MITQPTSCSTIPVQKTEKLTKKLKEENNEIREKPLESVRKDFRPK